MWFPGRSRLAGLPAPGGQYLVAHLGGLAGFTLSVSLHENASASKKRNSQYGVGRMAQKSPLEIYRAPEYEIKKELLFDDTKGSSLLFEERGGALNTRTYRPKVLGDGCHMLGIQGK